MPDFNGVTPIVKGDPISVFFIWADGTTRQTRLNLPTGAKPTPAEVDAYATNKAKLSNGGLWKYVGAGRETYINKKDADVNDELYGLGKTMLVEFVSASDPDQQVVDRVPMPNAANMNGYTLYEPDAQVQAYLTATLAVLNSNASVGDFGYSSSILDGYDAPRVIPNVVDPTGGQGEPAQPV